MNKSPALPFIDYAAVKAATSIEMVLKHYGLFEDMNPDGVDAFRGCCPIHQGTDDSQFSVSLTKNAWRCFSKVGCVPGGNHLDLVMHLEDCTLSEAAWKMNEWFQLGMEKHNTNRSRTRANSAPVKSDSATERSRRPPAPAAAKPAVPPPPKQEEENGENKPLGFQLQNLDPSHPYLVERGLGLKTIIEFGLGHCPKGIMAGRIVIPIHNASGELIGNAGRWPGDPPENKEKYRLPGGFKKSADLFNSHRAFASPPGAPLVIAMSYFPVFHLWQRGYHRAVALMDSSLSRNQEEAIRGRVGPGGKVLVLLPDSAACQEARRKILERLSPHCFVSACCMPHGDFLPEYLDAIPLDDLLK